MPGVSTPSAAAVCAAVIGLARLMHTPNGAMLRNGTLSLIVATGLFSALTMLVGNTLSELGAAPIEHINIAPIATGWPMSMTVAELATGRSRVGDRSEPSWRPVGADQPPRVWLTNPVESSGGELGVPASAWFEFGRALLVHRSGALPRAPDFDADAEAQEAAAARLDSARAVFHTSLSEDTTFGIIASNASLPIDDAELLAVAATAEIDGSCNQLMAEVQGHPARNRMTLGSIAMLLGPSHSGAICVSPDAPLRRAAYVDVEAVGPWAEHHVIVYPTLLWALFGDTSRNPQLPSETTFFEHDPDPTNDSLADPSMCSDFVVVNGADRLRRRQTGAQHSVSNRFVCARAPDTNTGWAALVCEATISGRGICIEIDDALPEPARRWITQAHHLAWVVSAESGPEIDDLPERSWLSVLAEAAEPTDHEWAAVLGSDTPRSHRLSLDQLRQVGRARSALGGDLDAAVRRLTSGRLDKMTQRIRPTRGWDDIVLSKPRIDLLQSIAKRYQHANLVYDHWGFAPTPSRGLVALFSGPSGTGKTLAAEIVAGALGLDVFKLDLSSVVSKYIGETEKNLDAVFDAAASGNMVLFFDEADALFGKRSEVKDARDRYANIEVSYLLQRLESYDGIVVLATNFEKNIDDAFLRRIHARIEFMIPGVDERVKIWQQNLPETAPVQDVDISWLAEQFELSGGAIRNAAVQAAFVAASAGSNVTMECVVTGIAREFQKMGRILKERDFGEFFPMLSD